MGVVLPHTLKFICHAANSARSLGTRLQKGPLPLGDLQEASTGSYV